MPTREHRTADPGVANHNLCLGDEVIDFSLRDERNSSRLGNFNTGDAALYHQRTRHASIFHGPKQAIERVALIGPDGDECSLSRRVSAIRHGRLLPRHSADIASARVCTG